MALEKGFMYLATCTHATAPGVKDSASRPVLQKTRSRIKRASSYLWLVGNGRMVVVVVVVVIIVPHSSIPY